MRRCYQGQHGHGQKPHGQSQSVIALTSYLVQEWAKSTICHPLTRLGPRLAVASMGFEVVEFHLERLQLGDALVDSSALGGDEVEELLPEVVAGGGQRLVSKLLDLRQWYTEQASPANQAQPPDVAWGIEPLIRGFTPGASPNG
jgi:hypothetical protein